MNIDKTTIRILVRKDYGACYDFYTGKLGLVPYWGGREGPYTSLSVSAGAPPCLALFSGANMSDFPGYTQPAAATQPDTIMAVISTDDLDGDYRRLKEAGVEFLSEPRQMDGWGMRCTYFRDPEGNLFELNDAAGI